MHMKTMLKSIITALAVFSVGAFAQQESQQQQRSTQGQQQSAGQKQQQGAKNQQGQAQGQAPVVVLMPVAIYPRGEQIANGCWVRLYEGNNFEGRQLTVIGPADLPNVEENVAVFGFDSAMVGPKASVTAYDGENYEDRTAKLEAGKKYPDLGDTKLGLFEDIESMRVSC